VEKFWNATGNALHVIFGLRILAMWILWNAAHSKCESILDKERTLLSGDGKSFREWVKGVQQKDDVKRLAKEKL
jgi:hypothetical protein